MLTISILPKNKTTTPTIAVGVVISYQLKLVEVEALSAIEVTLDTALRSLDELLAVDDDVGNLLV